MSFTPALWYEVPFIFSGTDGIPKNFSSGVRVVAPVVQQIMNMCGSERVITMQPNDKTVCTVSLTPVLWYKVPFFFSGTDVILPGTTIFLVGVARARTHRSFAHYMGQQIMNMCGSERVVTMQPNDKTGCIVSFTPALWYEVPFISSGTDGIPKNNNILHASLAANVAVQCT